MSEDFKKVVRLGTKNLGKISPSNIYCKIEYNDGRLSISGVEGPFRNGNCAGSCGQIIMTLREEPLKTFAPGWDKTKYISFLNIWDEWHLNDLVAGSPEQEKYLKEHPSIDKDYDARVKALTDAGLNPDNSYMHNGEPYKYGHAWLRKEVPEKVLEFLKNLPDTDIEPAWV